MPAIIRPEITRKRLKPSLPSEKHALVKLFKKLKSGKDRFMAKLHGYSNLEVNTMISKQVFCKIYIYIYISI
jgi:hypothetical protein